MGHIPMFAAPGENSEVLGIVVVLILVIGLSILGICALVNSVRVWSIGHALRKHFRGSYRQLPVVTRGFSILDVPNVRRAIDAFVALHQADLKQLTVKPVGHGLQAAKLAPGPAIFRQMDIDVEEREDCLVNPLYLLSWGSERIAIKVGGVSTHGYADPMLEIMAPSLTQASEFLKTLRLLMRKHSVYRGKVISLETNSSGMMDYDESPAQGQTRLKFHRLPPVEGDAIILPEETIRRVRRNTIGFFQNVQRLKQQGFSAKRGLMFHGPPGTGKTRTACWLTHSLPGVTVLLVTGEQLWNIKECCQLAKDLAPAMLILEDVDLIATRRDQNFQTTALHQLMNEMEGLDPETEVMFLLTTNQPDQIEPALSNRPGRIDQAIHFPLPDEACRQRLIELYRGKAVLDVRDWPTILEKTAGASPAFIKELIRKAALVAVEFAPPGDAPLVLTDSVLTEAFREMTAGDGKLTRRITGFAGAAGS